MDMNVDMIYKWNSVVPPNGLVYHDGDLSWYTKKWLKRLLSHLNGEIILLQGNHDRDKLQSLFKEVHRYLTLDIGGYKCFLTHRPVGVGDPKYWRVDYRKQAEGHDFCIVGHIHEKWLINKRNINIGVDQWDFWPISEERLIRFLDQLQWSYRL
jgi:calcineurin-like phosphoesterase family protein